MFNLVRLIESFIFTGQANRNRVIWALSNQRREFISQIRIWVFTKVIYDKIVYSVQPVNAATGLQLRVGEWNIVKIGNPKYAGQCKKARFKNIRVETTDSNNQKSVPIMSNKVIAVSCPTIKQFIIWDICNILCVIMYLTLFKSELDTLVDYTNSILTSYRSLTHDAIMIYGFDIEHASAGALKTTFTIEDGLRWVKV